MATLQAAARWTGPLLGEGKVSKTGEVGAAVNSVKGPALCVRTSSRRASASLRSNTQRLQSRPASGQVRGRSLKMPLKVFANGSVEIPDVPTPRRPPYSKENRSVMLQGFNWESAQQGGRWWEIMQENASSIAKAGYTYVWFPPCSQSADTHGYLPGQLYNLEESNYGSAEELKAIIARLNEMGVWSLADIVINHRSATSQDENGVWNQFEGGTEGKELDWGAEAVVKESSFGGQGAADTGDTYHAAPDIDHSNKTVQCDLIGWLRWMRDDVGFHGWRFDFSKGYDAAFTALYIEESKPTEAVGELWNPLNYEDGGKPAFNQDGHRQDLCNWIDGTGGRAAAFDFTTKGILQEAVQGELWRLKDAQGNAPGLIGWYPSRAVTFVDNHDTGSTQGHWPFPAEHVMAGYAYILTHPGIPCVFWDHHFDWGKAEEISALIAVRKRMGLHANSKLEILCAEGDLYVAKVDDRVVVKIGPRLDVGGLTPDGSQWDVAAFGEGYCVWENIAKRAELQAKAEDEPGGALVGSPKEEKVPAKEEAVAV